MEASSDYRLRAECTGAGQGREMEISELRTGEEDAWDSYVYESDAATFYHQIGWRNVVLKTYGHKPRYLVARGDDGGITGVLPMFLMESRVFGRKLVSVPFAPYGGVCADDAGVGRALVEEGKRAQTVFETKYQSHGGSGGVDTDETSFTSHGSHQSHFYPYAMIRTYANSERRMK